MENIQKYIGKPQHDVNLRNNRYFLISLKLDINFYIGEHKLLQSMVLTRLTIFIFLFLYCQPVLAQHTQTISGSVTDKESKTPLLGVTITVADLNPPAGTVTDLNGHFRIDNVPVGKHTIVVSYLGYQTVSFADVLVTSAREVVMPIEMEESAVKMNEVQVTQRKEHINEMAIVSTKTFDVQETERYAGSRNDPARMASNFAGVQGGDDSRNDIIIRGNSPQGLLWRLEGIDIPNPNHFAIPGTTGGSVSMLNDKTLANSDFFMGAFPAEYGDAVAGVFDLRLRNGNSDHCEFTGQFGFLGTELAGEGPISKKTGSSFLFTYRYSTLQIFEGLNIKIGTSSIPNYQDATFKLNFPIGKSANLSFFGIGGLSNIDIVLSDKKPSSELYGESDRDQYFTSNTGVAGVSYSYTINANTYTKVTVAETGNDIHAHHDYIFWKPDSTLDHLKDILGYRNITTSTVAHWYINKKLSSKQTIKFGIINNYYRLNLKDSSRQYPPDTTIVWQHRQDFIGGTDLLQAYVQYKYRPNNNTTFTAGLHAQYLTHSQSKALEPRIGYKKLLRNGDALTAGYGLHSQMLPLYIYFQHLPVNPASAMQNYYVDFIRSHHLVIGCDHLITNDLRLHLETYYQYLFNVPVETRAGSSYTILDQGTGYSRDFPDSLKNAGTGYNYGLELTLEKRFSHGYYFLFTGSLFDSKAKGNDGVYRNTDYNSHYTFNLLGGYEKKLGKNSVLITGIKITYAGGQLYSPPDITASNAKSDFVMIDSLRNTLQFKDYFRTDLKLGLRINSKKVTHEFGLDLVNIFGNQNILSLTYSSVLAQQGNAYPFYTQYQLGFLPIFYYRIDFSVKKK
jgi:hypothetical protein